MTSDPQRAQALFLAALELSDSAARQQLLERECAGDDTLRRSVEALLSAHDATMGFDVEPSNQASQTPTGAPSSIQLGERIGRYKLLETIGEGGMGSVWVAQQLEPIKRKVAIKLIKAGMSSRQFLARFEAERQALALMDHPNIAKVYDGGINERGQPFFVMELVNGLPLTKFCDQMRLSPQARLELFVPICQAVQHAHQKGIVHRDLKPANILITVIDGKPVPKVIDFGVAKATAGKLTDESLFTEFGAVVGTLEYMSPEQACFSGEDIDTRADIYSLGVILYELLTGLRPIDSNRLRKVAMAEMIRIIQEEEPSKPSTRLSSEESMPSLAALRMTEPKKLMSLLRGELDWVVMKCLEKQRERRYETANALARDIQRYLSDEIVEARPPSASYRLAKLLHKHRAALATIATVAIALLIGLGFATWQAIRATRAERHALEERDQAESARQSESEAKNQARAALRDMQKATARMAYERGQRMCEQGMADVGLQWITRSLDLLPDDASQLNHAFRLSLNAWAGQLNSYHHLDAPAAWSGVVEDLAITPDGQSLLTVDRKGNVGIYELFTGKLRFELNWSPDAESQQIVRPSVSQSLDGRLIAASRGNGQVQIWNAVTGVPLGNPLEHDEPVSMTAFDNLGTMLVAASGPNLHFWDVQSQQQSEEPSGFSETLSGLEFSRDGRQLLVWDKHNIYLLDITSRKVSVTFQTSDLSISHACLSPDGQYVLTNGRNSNSDSLAQFWNATSGTSIGRPMVWLDKRSQGQSCYFHPRGVVAMTSGFPIRAWEVPSGRPIGAVDSTFGAEHLAFHPAGHLLAAFGRSTERRLLDVAPLLFPIQTILLGERAFGMHSSPTGQHLVTSRWEGMRHNYQIINGVTGQKVGEPIECETNDPSMTPIDPAFSSDGQLVATPVGREGCQITHLTTGLEKRAPLATAATVRALSFSPDS